MTVIERRARRSMSTGTVQTTPSYAGYGVWQQFGEERCSHAVSVMKWRSTEVNHVFYVLTKATTPHVALFMYGQAHIRG